MTDDDLEPAEPSDLNEGQEVAGAEEEEAVEEDNDVIHVEWAGYI
jgi:hypothetical protein